MIAIPGFRGYSYDPATKRIWSNLSNKFVSEHPSSPGVYYLKADNAVRSGWDHKFIRTRITIKEVEGKIKDALGYLPTKGTDATPKPDTKTRGAYIVAKRGVNGRIQMDIHPKVYDSLEAAKEAATARAKAEKGTRFSVFKMEGTVVASDVTWS